MQVTDFSFCSSAVERKKKVEAALVKLQQLKSQVFVLRVQCEALKKGESERQKGLICSECGKLIEQGQEVVFKRSSGKLESNYHKECFKAIWLSQTWIFDYSCPGFLRKLGNGPLTS